MSDKETEQMAEKAEPTLADAMKKLEDGRACLEEARRIMAVHFAKEPGKVDLFNSIGQVTASIQNASNVRV